MTARKAIDIKGIVQGVGFRPFVYNLARRFGLTGWVINDSLGVSIEVQGEETRITRFIDALVQNPPPLAQITAVQVTDIAVRREQDFRIRESEQRDGKFTFVSPDISICDDCLRELFNPADRRFRYPFINCTNCGPRFTIIKDVPYDRPNTTMAKFPMCPDCLAEYRDPANRRFHAQPNACPVCGPRIWLTDGAGHEQAGDAIRLAIRYLSEGKIVAIKGLGGFHLAVDATREEAVQRLRLRKRRYQKPLALMVETVDQVKAFARVSGIEAQILTSPQRPICLLKKRPGGNIAPSVSPDNDYLGVMLPYTPLHYLIMREGGFGALVMTSGNLSEEPIVYRNREALERLAGIADYFLMNDRDIYQRADDSVVRVMNGRTSYIRRSRGFVPRPVLSRASLPSVLAVGGELKNSFCLNKERFFFLSQHIGDLENIQTLEFFEEGIRHFEKILAIRPQAIACDLHPEYLSTKWARGQTELPVLEIQHHHAHVASCMAERGLTGDVIGFSLDGTGYGPDGTIWGGEVLIASETDFRRAAMLRQVPLPGGDKAIREPWRMALAYGLESGVDLVPPGFFADVSETEWRVVSQMIEKRLNAPLTSSCGRLFDAVAALAGLRWRVGYEGQAAMQLEARLPADAGGEKDVYPFQLNREGGLIVIDWQPLFVRLFADLREGTATAEISRKFHLGLVGAFCQVAELLREEHGLNRVVLSGGCFQNRFLTEVLTGKLVENSFEVFYHTVVPPNDGGLSLGQAYIAASRIKKGEPLL